MTFLEWADEHLKTDRAVLQFIWDYSHTPPKQFFEKYGHMPPEASCDRDRHFGCDCEMFELLRHVLKRQP